MVRTAHLFFEELLSRSRRPLRDKGDKLLPPVFQLPDAAVTHLRWHRRARAIQLIDCRRDVLYCTRAFMERED